MAVDIAVLGLEVRSDGVVVASDRLKQLTAEGGKAEQATGKLSSSFANATKYIQAAVAAMAAWKLTEYAKEATLLAARVETLGVVMGVVGNNAGYTSKQMQEYDKAVQKMGITTQESRANLIKMAGSQMDLAKSTQLARVAQDAAVIGNINSSEAFGRMIQGIRSGETEILKNIGINVQFEQAYKKSAATLGKTSEQMTGAEKVTARMNAVLDYGKNIAGAYEASMGTAGKQLNSMSRYTEELRLKFGETFTPALSFVVVELTNALKDADAILGENKSTVDEWGQNFKSVVVSIAAEITRLSMLLDKAGGSMTSAAMLLFAPGAAMGNENSKKQFERFAQANLDYEARYKAGEDRLTRLAESLDTKPASGRTSAQEQASIDAARAKQAAEAAAAEAASSKASKEAERYRQTVVELRKDIDLLSTSMSDHEKALFSASVEYDKLILKYPQHRAELESLRAEKIKAIQSEHDLKNAIAETTKELAELQAQTEAMTAAERAYWQEIANTVKQVESLQPGAAVAAIDKQISDIYLMAEKLPDMAGKAQIAIDALLKFRETEQEIQDINNGLIDDPYQRQLAQIETFYQRKFDLIDQERNALMGLQDANKSNLDQYLKYQKKIEQLDDKEAALNREKTKETTETHADAMRSQLSMAGFYTSVAGDMFSALAETQDQSSRKGFETAKAFNLAATVMNTASAIMNAFATVPWPASVAAAALAATTGAIQIANIASTSFGGSAKAPSVPSGSFASGGAAGDGTGIGNMTSPLMSIQDSQTQESLERLTASNENVATAIGRLSKSMDDLTALFESGGAGMTLAKNAPNQGVDTSRIKGVGELLGDSFTGFLGDFFTADLWGMVSKPWSTLDSLLFGGGWKTTDAGISLSVDSGVIDADTYEKRKKSGGLFSSSKKKYRYTENEDLDTYMSALVQPYINDITRMAMTLGTNANLSTYSAPRTNISTAGRKPEDVAKDLEDWTLKTLQGMSMTVDGLEDVVGAYDDAYARLKEFNDALVSTNRAFELIGKTALQGSLATGEFLVAVQRDLFGGMEGFNEAIDTYFGSLFTDAEQEAALAAQAQRDLDRAFAEMGQPIPATRQEFRDLVNSLDITTVSGAQLFAGLMDVSEAFGLVMTAADEADAKLKEISSAMQDLDVRYLKATGKDDAADALSRQLSAQREIEAAITDNMGDAYLTRLREVLAAEESLIQQTAADEAAAALKSLATEMMALATQNLKSAFAAEKTRLTEAYNTELELMNQRISEAKTVVADLSGYVNKLTAARERMRLTDDASLRSEYQLAQARLASVLVAARGGDLSGLKEIDETLNVLTSQNENAYASSTDYQRDFMQAKNGITELEKITGYQLTDAKKSLQAQQTQIDLLKTNHESQLAALDLQLNALLGINNSVLSLYDAINAYSVAKTAASIISPAVSSASTEIDRLYSTVLNREADPVGKMYWETQAAAGMSMPEIFARFVDSAEYKMLNGLPAFAMGGITSGISIAGEAGPEAIIPLPDGRRVPVMMTGQADNSELIAEIRQLRAELRAAQAEIAKNTQKTARYIERWDGDGIPEVRAA